MIFISEIRSTFIFFFGRGGTQLSPCPLPPSTFHAQMVLSHLIVMVFPQTIRLDLSTLGMFVFFFTKNRCILIFSVLPPAIISQTKMCLKKYNKDLFKTSKTYTDL